MDRRTDACFADGGMVHAGKCEEERRERMIMLSGPSDTGSIRHRQIDGGLKT